MAAWNQNRLNGQPGIDYPIIQVLRECGKAIGGDGDMGSSKARILFIEDDADTRELVSYVLSRADYEVQLAENAERGALLAQSTSFELYLIDNWMPGASGIDLCTRLRKFDAHTPILFFSGAAYEQDKCAAIAAGAQGYLTKPADLEELLKAVSRLIGTHKAPAASASL